MTVRRSSKEDTLLCLARHSSAGSDSSLSHSSLHKELGHMEDRRNGSAIVNAQNCLKSVCHGLTCAPHAAAKQRSHLLLSSADFGLQASEEICPSCSQPVDEHDGHCPSPFGVQDHDCGVVQCPDIRALIAHMLTDCTSLTECSVPSCSPVRALLQHYNQCAVDCPVCTPIWGALVCDSKPSGGSSTSGPQGAGLMQAAAVETTCSSGEHVSVVNVAERNVTCSSADCTAYLSAGADERLTDSSTLSANTFSNVEPTVMQSYPESPAESDCGVQSLLSSWLIRSLLTKPEALEDAVPNHPLRTLRNAAACSSSSMPLSDSSSATQASLRTGKTYWSLLLGSIPMEYRAVHHAAPSLAGLLVHRLTCKGPCAVCCGTVAHFARRAAMDASGDDGLAALLAAMSLDT